MKKTFILAILLLSSSLIFAQNEQSFTITPHNKTHLATKTQYVKRAYFATQDKNISSVKLDFHLTCPDKGCSDWDYSINILLRQIHGTDTTDYQLGRMITPYSGEYNQGENAKTWDHAWNWDITEYLPLLKDSVDIVLSYEGYQDGFEATTNFVFSSDKDIKAPKFLGVQNVYFGYFPYGKEEDPIENYLKEKTITVPKKAKTVLARLTISGHGGDTLNAAAEFLQKSYHLYSGNHLVANQSVWKDDCGCNPLSPQGGTWIYNRAGWCPGEKVNEYWYDMTPYVKDGKLPMKITFDYYNGYASGDAGYQVAADVFFVDQKNYKHTDYRDIKDIVTKMNAEMKSSVTLPNNITLVVKTNNDGRDKFYIQDYRNRKIFEHSQVEPNTLYSQKISLNNIVDYALVVEDNDCDGLSWWASPLQGTGYVLLYNEDKTQLLDAFDPDFGCKIQYFFNCTNDTSFSKADLHKDYKLVTFAQDDSTHRVILFTPKDKEQELVISIINRKTKDTVLTQTYPKNNTFDISLPLTKFEKGYYWIKVSCGTFTRQRLLIVKGGGDK